MAAIEMVTGSAPLWNPNDGFNFDTLNPTQFKLIFNKIPHVTFFCQSVEIPSVSIGSAEQGSPLLKNLSPGEALEFSNLSITILLDSNLTNYKELFKWITEMSSTGGAVDKSSNEAILIIGETKKTEFRFVNIWPQRLGDVKLYSTPEIVEFAMCDVEFNYDYFYINEVVQIS